MLLHIVIETQQGGGLRSNAGKHHFPPPPMLWFLFRHLPAQGSKTATRGFVSQNIIIASFWRGLGEEEEKKSHGQFTSFELYKKVYMHLCAVLKSRQDTYAWAWGEGRKNKKGFSYFDFVCIWHPEFAWLGCIVGQLVEYGAHNSWVLTGSLSFSRRRQK